MANANPTELPLEGIGRDGENNANGSSDVETNAAKVEDSAKPARRYVIIGEGSETQRVELREEPGELPRLTIRMGSVTEEAVLIECESRNFILPARLEIRSWRGGAQKADDTFLCCRATWKTGP
jgi:hypothetical protein